MNKLVFTPKTEVITKGELIDTSNAVESFAASFGKGFEATIRGTKSLDKLEHLIELTGYPENAGVGEINKELTLTVLEMYYLMESMKGLLKITEDFQNSIKMANSREWYRHFIKTYPQWKGGTNAE